ncbi:deoxyhypusine hydroxylase-like [Octopus sinensis]|uniref:Deoxyhypusine hydroxylase-like n=1 Tax=Octopus sinensis TaxID=2607531 RepID=A0A6P7U1S5_9MOLL|nr:deoxyhypusine hydroxylase-like [Octopus sinensis]
MSSCDVTRFSEIILDTTRPISERFSTLLKLGTIPGEQKIEAISKLFSDKSILLKHECAYVLGQTQNPTAIPVLIKNLKDEDQDVITRHECGLKCGSSLFRHEIAYVLGQLQNELSIDALKESCECELEAPMVRHEAVEALSSIGLPRAMDVLRGILKSDTTESVVIDSCLVGCSL